jgi:peptidoglycan/LPS O-acetylase OafA/YrhL
MNRQFPAFRGLAILIVVLYHTILLTSASSENIGNYAPTGIPHYILLALSQIGVFAVPTFLFISGCFISYSTRGSGSRLPVKIVSSGLKHLLVPYIFWSIIFYLIIYVFHGQAYSLPGYIKNILVGYPFHFIPLMVFYFLLSPIIVLLGKQFGLLILTIIALYQVILLNLEYPGILGSPSPEWMGFLSPPVLSRTMADWGIYFPLGIIYGLNTHKINPWFNRFKLIFLLVTVILFISNFLMASSVLSFSWIVLLSPITFLFFAATVPRNVIPFVRFFETIGKRSYGLYLTHLIVLDILLIILESISPLLLTNLLFIIPILFILTLAIPVLVMENLARIPTKGAYRYVFG